MVKVVKLEDLDCALCAQKMEDGIKKIDGVKSISVNFITQKMIIEVDDSYSFDEVMKKVVKTCKKIEPDCRIIR